MEGDVVDSEVCQKCARCCKVWWMYTDCKDDAVRASWLDTDLISVIKIKESLWKLLFNMPCKELEEKDGKYWCKKHLSPFRPGYCKTYPSNFKNAEAEVLKDQKKMCKLI